MTDVALSPRMEEIVALVAGRGFSYGEAAYELGISEHTVRTYAEEIGKRARMTPRKAMFWYFHEVMKSGEVA